MKAAVGYACWVTFCLWAAEEISQSLETDESETICGCFPDRLRVCASCSGKSLYFCSRDGILARSIFYDERTTISSALCLKSCNSVILLRWDLDAAIVHHGWCGRHQLWQFCVTSLSITTIRYLIIKFGMWGLVDLLLSRPFLQVFSWARSLTFVIWELLSRNVGYCSVVLTSRCHFAMLLYWAPFAIIFLSLNISARKVSGKCMMKKSVEILNFWKAWAASTTWRDKGIKKDLRESPQMGVTMWILPWRTSESLLGRVYWWKRF